MNEKTNETFKNGSVSKAKAHGSVGGQGNGGELGGASVYGVNNPRGVEPKKIGGGRMPLAQDPVQPKVGK